MYYNNCLNCKYQPDWEGENKGVCKLIIDDYRFKNFNFSRIIKFTNPDEVICDGDRITHCSCWESEEEDNDKKEVEQNIMESNNTKLFLLSRECWNNQYEQILIRASSELDARTLAYKENNFETDWLTDKVSCTIINENGDTRVIISKYKYD